MNRKITRKCQRRTGFKGHYQLHYIQTSTINSATIAMLSAVNFLLLLPWRTHFLVFFVARIRKCRLHSPDFHKFCKLINFTVLVACVLCLLGFI